MPKQEHLKLPEVLEEIGTSRAAFYRWRARGRAPKGFKLPNGELRFKRAELDAWWAQQEEKFAA